MPKMPIIQFYESAVCREDGTCKMVSIEFDDLDPCELQAAQVGERGTWLGHPDNEGHS